MAVGCAKKPPTIEEPEGSVVKELLKCLLAAKKDRLFQCSAVQGCERGQRVKRQKKDTAETDEEIKAWKDELQK